MEKHFWLGVALLLLLLFIALGITWCMSAIHTPVAQTLEQAKKAALSGDWQQAKRLCLQARLRWDRFRSLSAAFADHDPIEDADSLFAELELYAQNSDQTEFAACCAKLHTLVRAVVQAHVPSWWNLL